MGRGIEHQIKRHEIITDWLERGVLIDDPDDKSTCEAWKQIQAEYDRFDGKKEERKYSNRLGWKRIPIYTWWNDPTCDNNIHPFEKKFEKYDISVNECKKMLIEIRDHDSNLHRQSLIPRLQREESMSGDWLDRLKGDIKYKSWINLMRFTEYLKSEKNTNSTALFILNHLHEYQNGALVLENNSAYKGFLKKLGEQDFNRNDLQHFTRASYLLPFLEATGVGLSERNKIYRSQDDFNAHFVEIRDANSNTIQQKEALREMLAMMWKWATCDLKQFKEIEKIWMENHDNQDYVQVLVRKLAEMEEELGSFDLLSLEERIQKSIIFTELHHRETDRKKEFTRIVDDIKVVLQPAEYNAKQLEAQDDILQLIWTKGHRIESGFGLCSASASTRRLIQYNRIKGLHIFQYDGCDAITGLPLKSNAKFNTDFHHMFYKHDMDEFGSDFAEGRKKLVRADIIGLVGDVDEFEKIAIEEALLTIAIDPDVHKLIHFMLGKKNYSRLVDEMGMLPYFDYVKDIEPIVFPEDDEKPRSKCPETDRAQDVLSESSTKENNDPIANVARAISYTAKTDRKKKPRSKRPKKIPAQYNSDSDDDFVLGPGPNTSLYAVKKPRSKRTKKMMSTPNYADSSDSD